MADPTDSNNNTIKQTQGHTSKGSKGATTNPILRLVKTALSLPDRVRIKLKVRIIRTDRTNHTVLVMALATGLDIRHHNESVVLGSSRLFSQPWPVAAALSSYSEARFTLQDSGQDANTLVPSSSRVKLEP